MNSRYTGTLGTVFRHFNPQTEHVSGLKSRYTGTGTGTGTGGSGCRIWSAALLVILVLSLAAPCLSLPQEKTLADGVTLIQDINTDPQAPIVVSALRIDPKKAGVKLAAVLGQDGVIENDATGGREVVSTMVARKGALAGVNADYFPWTGDPLGLAIVGGELVSEPADRVAVGITAAGEVILDRMTFLGAITAPSGATSPLSGVNRQRGQNELVLFTPAFGAATGAKDGIELVLTLDGPVRANKDLAAVATSDPGPPAGAPAPGGGAILSAHGSAADWLQGSLHSGDKLKLRLDIKAVSGRSWDDVVEAVGGGPWLLKSGEVSIDAADERFKPDMSLVRHPRTAAGITPSGELLLVTVDGRQTISRGMTLSELAALMKALGAVEAINLDGGGSTSLSVTGLVVNSPSGGKERPVADALLVYAPPTPRPTASLKFADAAPLVVPSGEGRMLSLVDEAAGQPLSDELAAGIIWGTAGGIGFVNQKGWFVPIKVGTGSVIALAGDRRLELAVTVVPGRPANLSASIVPDPSGAPNRGQVAVTLTDANGNPVPGKAVAISATGAVPDTASATTDGSGAASFAVTWDSTSAAASVTISAAGLSAKAR